MTPAQNRCWLAALQGQGVADQWARIRSRYFSSPQQASPPHSEVASIPLLIVEGIIIDETSAGSPVWEVLATQLTPAKVKDITVMEREPEGLYINKVFTGWIIITLADKPLRKVLRQTIKRSQQPLGAN